MNIVHGVGSQSPVQKIVASPVQKSLPANAPAQMDRADKVELSGIAGFLQTLKANDIRAEKVAEVKAAIEAGTYEDDAKLDLAIDRLLDDLR